MPAHEDDAPAVILFDDTETTVRPNGQIETLHRRAVRILRPEGRSSHGRLEVAFDKETKISYMKGWSITADGHEFSVTDKDAIEQGYLDDLVYQDTKVKILQLPEAEPGNVVGYEYVQQDRPYLLEDDWEFQETVPVKAARFELRLPPGWGYSAHWFNHANQDPQITGSNDYVWRVSDIPAVHIEIEMPPWKTVSGWVGIKYLPSDQNLRAKSAATWNDVGIWYSGLAESRRTSDPAIHQKVQELTAGISEPMGRIRAITEYMQRDIRYFAVEVGIGGFQPHFAADVFRNQYGDCKDKATLLSTMLRELGIDSYYVTLDDYRNGVHPDYPSHSFNHMILAIQLPKGADAANLYSAVDDPELGKLLIFDPTNEYVPLGYIPWYEQGTYGLLIRPDGGQLISLPVSAPATNRLLRTAQLSLSPDGTLAGEVEEAAWGAPAHQRRGEYNEVQPSKRVELLEHFLQPYLPNFSLRGATLGNLEKNDEAFVIDYKFASAGYARSAGNELLVRPRVVGDKDTALLQLFSQSRPREYGIELDSAARQDDVIDITLPGGFALDGDMPPVEASCDFADYESKVEVKEGVLHYTRTFEVKQVHVPAEKLGEMKAFLQKVASDQNMYVALKPTGTQTAARPAN